MSNGFDTSELRVVVFDMDDTLYPEMQFVRGGMDAAAQLLSERSGAPQAGVRVLLGELLDEDLRQYGRARSVFDRAMEQLGLMPTAESVRDVVEAYRSHAPHLTPFPDVPVALPSIASRFPLGLITDGPSHVQRAKFDALGLEKRFAFAVFTGDAGPEASKPAPWGYQEHESHFGMSGSAFVYVADNPAKDFVGARALGWHTVRIRRQEGLHASVEAAPGYEADAELRSLAELPTLLGIV